MSAAARMETAPKIGVVGCGYLGAVHAACLSHWGFDVIGFDVSDEKIRMLSQGRAPFFEADLDDLVKDGLRSGRLAFTSELSRLEECSMVFLCVGTPQLAGSDAADLSQIESAFASALEFLKPGSLIVGKSTVPVGTAATFLPRAFAANHRLAWNPEFLREGTAVNDTLYPDRIVLGVCDASAEDELRSVYAEAITEGAAVVVTDLPTAEVIKEAANSFLATKISFINAVSELCDVSGADVVDVAHALGLDERIGPKFLKSGIGYGGGCFPKDVRALAHRAGEIGAPSLARMLDATDDTNSNARRRALDLVLRESSGAKKIALLGAAFKPGSDDLRDSPAVWLMESLRTHLPSVDFTWHDPILAGRVVAGVELSPSVADAVRDSDVSVLVTDWPEYRELDPVSLHPRRQVLIDLRHGVYAPKWVRAGWSLHFLGRPSQSRHLRPGPRSSR